MAGTLERHAGPRLFHRLLRQHDLPLILRLRLGRVVLGAGFLLAVPAGSFARFPLGFLDHRPEYVHVDVVRATVAELMARAGHTTPKMAMRYQHIVEGRDVDLVRRMSARVNGE